jgi:hypothetical protein
MVEDMTRKDYDRSLVWNKRRLVITDNRRAMPLGKDVRGGPRTA